MEAVAGIILIVALVSGAMLMSSNDVESDTNLFWCFGLCMKMENDLIVTPDPNDPENPEEMKDEIRDDIRDGVMGKRCGSAAHPVC